MNEILQNPASIPIEIFIGLSLLTILMIVWIFTYGFMRGVIAGFFRAIWILAIFSALFPEVISEKLPTKIGLKKLNILVDDSESMRLKAGFTSPLDEVEEHVKKLRTKCSIVGCSLNILNMSDFSDAVKNGKSPIFEFAQSVVDFNENSPWILFTDGGDMNPRKSFKSSDIKNKVGLVIAKGIKEDVNIWLDNLEVPSFGFAEKPSLISVRVNRNIDVSETKNIQIQIQVDGNTVTSANVRFSSGEMSKVVEVVIPSQQKGHHLLSVASLPTKSEKLFWDNMVFSHFETVPNTIGVLHLSGSPTPDSRFMRRFIKSEPKIDLISFFILRDPWDSQYVSEREMSLIPFPAERLFTQELANFKLVIIQNFRMLQFLNSKYQKNLVDFVENGGGLLFIGGPRSFNYADIKSENLARILPFELDGSKNVGETSPSLGIGGNNDKPSPATPWYDRNLNFTVDLPVISESKRELATVYEDVADLVNQLKRVSEFSGLHHMEQVAFSEVNYTKLLSARYKNKVYPLMGASFPKKGRAIWLYTDQFWKIATSEQISRSIYNKLYQGIFNWLVRDDIKKPIMISKFEVFADQGSTHYNVSLTGPAVRYYEHNDSWKFRICGRDLKIDDYTHSKTSNLEVEIVGTFKGMILDGRVCGLKIDASHKSFGNEKLESLTYIKKAYFDKELPYSLSFLTQMTSKIGVKLVNQEENVDVAINTFVNKFTNDDGIRLPPKVVTTENRYWFFQSYWLIFAILAMPLEIITRRWEKIVG